MIKALILTIGLAAVAPSIANGQMFYDQYGNAVNSYTGQTTPNPAFSGMGWSNSGGSAFSAPSMPAVPQIGGSYGGGPYGSAIPEPELGPGPPQPPQW